MPISLVRRRPVAGAPEGPAKLHLYGYGSYGISVDPKFNSPIVSLLDRGWIYAIAHVRGSSTCGRTWYEAGKFHDKANTFSDFVACGEHLVREGYTTHDKMSIEGRSAGGLLVGAAPRAVYRGSAERCATIRRPGIAASQRSHQQWQWSQRMRVEGWRRYS